MECTKRKCTLINAHLIYPERDAVFLPLNQSYRGVGIYRTADEAGQTNGHIDDRWHVYHAGRIYKKKNTEREKEGEKKEMEIYRVMKNCFGNLGDPVLR